VSQIILSESELARLVDKRLCADRRRRDRLLRVTISERDQLREENESLHTELGRVRRLLSIHFPTDH
jgi:hypothetical protein